MQRRSLLPCVLLVLGILTSASHPAAQPAAKQAPSEPTGPMWDMARLSQTPKIFPAEGFRADGMQALFYEGEPYRGKPTRVFAWLGIPKMAGGTPAPQDAGGRPAPQNKAGQKLPGMILVHGGGGTAFDTWVRLWNQRGYAAIAMDTCGCVPVGTYGKWKRHEAGGPPGWGGYNQIGEPRGDQWTYHAVAAAILANSLLRAQPEVDPERIGLTGISWGGYLTSIIQSVDHRFKFAVPVYGCGFTTDHAFAKSVTDLGPERAARWMRWWDPSSYLKQATLPVLWVNGSNDFAYTLNAYQKSYRLAPGPRTLCIRLRMPHGHGPAGEAPKEIHVFADSILKGGVPLAKITGQGRDGRQVWATYESQRPIKKAELNVTRDSGRWQDRKWDALPAQLGPAGGRVTATLPQGVRVYYLNLFDDRDCAVSTEHEELPAPRGAAERPNVVVFLVDDMGWQDTSVPFHTQRTPWNERYRTPNMERLAAQGMKFTQAYACPVCTPTRVSLLTGLSAVRHGVTNWTLFNNTPTDARHPLVQPPAWNVNGLSPDPATPRAVCAPTLAQLLREAGYHTIHVGKAHFGAFDTPGADPRNLGFDVNIAGHAAGGPGSYLGEQGFSAGPSKGDRIWTPPGLEKYHGKDIFLTEALTIEARKAMDQAVAAKKPFFLYFAHYAVHVPYAPDKRFIQKYRDAGLGEIEAMYAALVEGMDKSLGDILDNLECHQIADKTIVVFLSDNGGLSAHGRGGKPHTHNAPLSSGKGSAREGGVRVPMLVKWPGVTRPGSVCRQYVICEDLLPSILEMTGADKVVNNPPVDGVSYVPLLKQSPGYPSDRALVWHYPNIWGPTGPGLGPFSAIRRGDWKLIYYHADQRFELFNLADDLSEEHNLADAKPEKLRDLARELSARMKSVGAKMPTSKKTGRPVPLPDAAACGTGASSQ